MTTVDVPSPAPPLRLLSLGDCSGAARTLPLRPGDALLFYTDGVTEARNLRHRCYPLLPRLTELVRTSTDGLRPDLLEHVRADLLQHAGAPLDDDAALVLVKTPAAGGGQLAPPAAAGHSAAGTGPAEPAPHHSAF